MMSITPRDPSTGVDDRWANLCTVACKPVTTVVNLPGPTTSDGALCMTVDNHPKTFWGLTSTNATLSTIHTPYYPYYSLYNQKEKVSAR